MSESYQDFDFATNTELAQHEGILPSYMTCVMQLDPRPETENGRVNSMTKPPQKWGDYPPSAQ